MSKQLLQNDDSAPFRVHNEGGDSRCIVVCDHAENAIPIGLCQLGLEDVQLQSHIAWDIGALNVANCIAEKLNAVVVSSNFSRLVIDCNRYPHAPTSILEVSDGALIPGNTAITADQAYLRQLEIFEPYHRAIEAQMLKKIAVGVEPILLSIHSMTAKLAGETREWPISIQSYDDKRLSENLLHNLREAVEFPIGDNKPYKLEPSDFTVFEHAISRAARHVQVEFRQDWVATVAGVEKVSAAFCDAFVPILEDPEIDTKHQRGD